MRMHRRISSCDGNVSRRCRLSSYSWSQIRTVTLADQTSTKTPSILAYCRSATMRRNVSMRVASPIGWLASSGRAASSYWVRQSSQVWARGGLSVSHRPTSSAGIPQTDWRGSRGCNR